MYNQVSFMFWEVDFMRCFLDASVARACVVSRRVVYRFVKARKTSSNSKAVTQISVQQCRPAARRAAISNYMIEKREYRLATRYGLR